LLKQKWSLPTREWLALLEQALAAFLTLVRHPVPSHV